MDHPAKEQEDYVAIDSWSTEDGLLVEVYKIGDRSFVDLDWEAGSKWEMLKDVEPEQILDIILQGLCAEEGEIQEITSGIKVLSVYEWEELGGDEFMHALGERVEEVEGEIDVP